MTELLHALHRESNPQADTCSVKIFWRDFFVPLFPDKTAAYVASFTRTSVRASEHLLSGRNGLSQRGMFNLLRSPIGDQVLDAIVGEATEWRALERRLIEIEKLQLELKKREQAISL